MTATVHTILLVDDEEALVVLLARLLTREGYRVLTATSAAAALDLLAAGGVDMILSDLDMPKMNGLELLSRVRKSNPEVVRLLLTGGATLDSALKAINDGEVYRYLTKPWDNEALKATVRSGFERLDELRRMAFGERELQVRTRMLAALEAEHPGIRTVVKTEGVYALDSQRLEELVESSGSPVLKGFFRM
jgi:DNA-binding NtrC family response regulator